MNPKRVSQESELKERLKSLENKQFTGVIKVEAQSGKIWRIYLCLSRIVWADGGNHCNRTWRRLWLKYFPNFDTNNLNISELGRFECWDYYGLNLLLKKRLIGKEHVIRLMDEKIEEILFDIRQIEAIEEVNYVIEEAESADFLLKIGLNVSLNLLTIESCLNKLDNSWEKWSKLNLDTFSPNSAPLLKEADKLEKTVSPVIYKNFLRILNGKFTLRTLALKMNQDLFKLTASLANYIQKGWVELVEIPDLADELTPLKLSHSNEVFPVKQEENKGLIACIDDSPQVIEIMKKYITEAGYQFMGIQDALQAVPILMEKTPDLIFLDLVMPIVNGYELCSQMKRVSKLETIPIVILTGNDGVVDRVRSKMVGSDGFMAKPIIEKDVINKIEKILLMRKNKEKNDNSSLKSESQKTQLSSI